MSAFGDALKKAGIMQENTNGYNKKKAGAFTLEMKLYEMEKHIQAMSRIYQKYLNTEEDDKFDYVDSLANRYGYMVMAFQDIMTVIGKVEGFVKKTEDVSIRRAITEFQSLFEEECRKQRLDDALISFAERNEIVHLYQNYTDNMEVVLENVQNYVDDYEKVRVLLWNYCERKGILSE